MGKAEIYLNDLDIQGWTSSQVQHRIIAHKNPFQLRIAWILFNASKLHGYVIEIFTC